MKNKYIFWWDSPCKGIIGVLKSFCEDLSNESIAITGDLGKFRGSMGWHDQGKYFENHLVVQRDNKWIEKTVLLFEKYKTGYIHVFGGVTSNKTEHLVRLAIKNNVKYCIMSENPANLHFGLMKLIKDAYIKFYLPFYSKTFARKAQLVFCLCGHKHRFLKYFKQNGYSFEKIVPYGYWTDSQYEDIQTIKEHQTIKLICPGLLKRYKRVDLLLLALHDLVNRGFVNFQCHLIGDGEYKENLKLLTKKLGIEDYVVFDGVLDEKHPLITKSDILIAPGSVEPWGIRINEAIQRAQVVISSEGVGASYLIEESGGGKVFKIGSYKHLADCIQFYLEDYKRINDAKQSNQDYRNKISCNVKARELYSHLNNLSID
jgi:glycosyltransferase involved in cell wall biosynthesis